MGLENVNRESLEIVAAVCTGMGLGLFWGMLGLSIILMAAGMYFGGLGYFHKHRRNKKK